MFNSSVKKEALEKLAEAERQNSEAMTAAAQASEALTIQRNKAAEFIGLVEHYVNGLANTPKEFKRQVAESKEAAQAYQQLYIHLKKESEKTFSTASGVVGLGATLAVGVMALGPKAAMSVARNFGTSSTGTPISALSGAAATSATKAWLGGGSREAGGGGMAAGNKLLSLAGPVGWGIGGIALIGSGLMYHIKNAEVAEEANEHCAKVIASTEKFKMAYTTLKTLERQTSEHLSGGFGELRWLTENAPHNYLAFSVSQRQRLGALVNHAHALGESIGQEVSL